MGADKRKSMQKMQYSVLDGSAIRDGFYTIGKDALRTARVNPSEFNDDDAFHLQSHDGFVESFLVRPHVMYHRYATIALIAI
jgi:hypothetical protein